MKRYRCLLIGMFVLASLALRAQIPTGYYDNAEGKTGDALKTALHDIIKGHTVHGYSSLNNIYAYTDCYSDGKIWDIYSNKHWSLSSACGNYSGEGDCWNKEHTWPSSWFKDKNTPRCDLFHVMPTDGYVNNRRSNYPYGEVGNATWTSSNGSKLGSCSTTGYSGTVFEPVDEYKGDIARNFFYMSVRYYGEDSGWSTSGMTNKSTILDWAMTMLLRWHEADPVSDKEIARNNAVYGYQNNRNPFIDHPEYAPMIWDPNYTPAETHAITCASNLSHGSISAPANAAEGSTVAITATPDAGYMVSSYSVYKTDDTSITVTVSSNGTFTMPAYNVTVSATFEVNNTYYNIALGTVSHGSISVSANSAKSGTTITMSATPENGYSLYSWYVYKTSDINTIVYTGTTGSFVMPAFDVTVMATFVQGSSGGNGDYVKVTSAPTDWSGEYLIVYEGGNVAFNGALTSLDATGNTISVTINSDNTITRSTTTTAAEFTIAGSGSSYTIQSASGYYIGSTSDANGMNSSTTTAYSNSISYNNGAIDIVGSGGAYLRYNKQSGQERFRYFKSGTYTNQQAIQLYKKMATVPTHTIHFNNNGGTGSMYDQTVNEFEATALNANTFTREGFEFDGWNTEANGTGTYYADEATITLTNDVTLYAQWDPQYSITVTQPDQHGTISASHSAAVEGTTITLTATPEAEYALKAWTVTDGNGNTIDVVENQFEMPADNVTVTARFWYVGVAQVSYHLVTSTDELVAGEKYLIVNTANNKALGTTQNENNRSAEEVTITNNVINSISSTVCELELGGSTGTWTLFDAGYSNGTGGYLYAASSSKNYLRTQATNDDNGKWAITITTTGVATITAQGSNTHKLLKYNSQSTIFSCYESGQQDVRLFRRVETHPTPVEQPLALNAGWNWWSTYVELSNLDGLALLEEVLGTNGQTISSQGEGSAMYNANQGQWMSGFSNNLITGHMYQIQLANPVEGSLEGLLANPADHPVTLVTGWNWLGYPLNVTMELNAALVNLTATPGDVIKYQNAFATYYEGYGWFGTLKNLVPGQGYMYHTDATVSKTFTFPTGQ